MCTEERSSQSTSSSLLLSLGDTEADNEESGRAQRNGLPWQNRAKPLRVLLLIHLVSPSGILLPDLQMGEVTASKIASLYSWTSKGNQFGVQTREEGEK